MRVLGENIAKIEVHTPYASKFVWKLKTFNFFSLIIPQVFLATNVLKNKDPIK